jgi:transposase
VLACDWQDAVRDRTTAHNKLRSCLREYFPWVPGRLRGRPRRHHPARGPHHLGRRPTPADAAKLTLTQLRGLLKKAGHSRGLDTEATRLHDAFRVRRCASSPSSKTPWAARRLALPGQLDAACAAADGLEQAAAESFNLHPDAGIITSFPGLGPLTGARVLAEIGGDRSRLQDAKGLKAYADAAPIARASGKTNLGGFRVATNG